MERREGEEHGCYEADRPSGSPCDKNPQRRHGPNAPRDGWQLALPASRIEVLHGTGHEIVQRRMHSVETKALPEEVPGASDIEALKDLVEAVREMIEAKEPNGRGSREDEAPEDDGAAAHGRQDNVARLRPLIVESKRRPVEAHVCDCHEESEHKNKAASGPAL